MDFVEQIKQILEGPWPAIGNAIDFLHQHASEMTKEEFEECCSEMMEFRLRAYENDL